MSQLPIILAVEVDNSTHSDVTKLLISGGEVKKNQDFIDGCSVCKINTKYYTANVQFSPIRSKKASVENIRSRIEAVMFYVDHPIDSLTKELDDWLPVLRKITADIKILLSKNSIPVEQKETVDAWCLKNHYELIEIDNNEDPTSDSESDCNEKYGIERLVEVLQTHRWSSLQEKMIINVAKQELDPRHRIPHSLYRNRAPESSPVGTPPEDPDDPIYYTDELHTLFQNLKSMKLNISNLSGDEKLDQAEKVVKSFWTAIGGDSNEFSDSDHEI